MKAQEKTDDAGNDLQIQASIKRPKRFKAGAETGGSVNISVEVTEEDTAHMHHLVVDLRIREGSCGS